jgi:hypothetical protein
MTPEIAGISFCILFVLGFGGFIVMLIWGIVVGTKG